MSVLGRMVPLDVYEELEIRAMPVSWVYKALQTRPEGLLEAEAEARLLLYGRNALEEPKKKSLFSLAANFTHLMALLLWAGGLMAFLAGLPQLGAAIWLVNLMNGAFSYWQEHKAEKATEALARMLPAYARVLREGKERSILAEELVPGDVVLLAEGDRISADARLVKQSDLKVDQSALTGESRSVPKSTEPPSPSSPDSLVFAGTSVSAGSGTAVVFATGMQTRFGRIAGLTQSVGEGPSPLQKELKSVTSAVTLIALGSGLVFFSSAVLLAGMRPQEGLIFAIGMIVAFVPEGLLPTLTLSLAMGVQRMARRNALIKRLSVVETLGSANVICTDKTGTLTQNEMTVTDLYVGDKKLLVTGTGYSPQGRVVGAAGPELRQMLMAAGLCSNARISRESGRGTPQGDPTEAALLIAAAKAGIDLDLEAKRSPRLLELPFDPCRKRMTTIHRQDGSVVAYSKGSPQELLELCTRAILEGLELPLDGALREGIRKANDDFASRGLRVLAVAMRHLQSDFDANPEALEMDMTFLGLAAMMDPPRPEVRGAVQKCHSAGIRIIMITGDYGLTAESIARQVDIINSDYRILTGSDLDSMDDSAFEEALAGDVILARVTPEHKMRAVLALQGMGLVVAVTGDGVNDAPALKSADIGIALGSGTDVAREAADMILADDNFASIVNAVEEGRAVYSNIKKFTTYILTSNAPEAVPFILFALSGGHIPLALNIMQILSVDLGTDILPALALGAEAPEPGVMNTPPRSPRSHIITPGLLAKSYLLLGGLESLAAISAFYFQYWTCGYWGQILDLPSAGPLYRSATSMALAAIITTQIGNLFAQRTERRSFFHADIFGNRLIWAGIAAELAIVISIIYLPPLQWIFGTASIPAGNWLFLLAWMPAPLLADEILKAWK